MTALELNRVHYPVTVLGPGTRAGIWVQGCMLACPGCLARDTWEPAADRAVAVEDILRWLDSLPRPLDGITISGGEPFQQQGITALVSAIDAWRDRSVLDVLVYTGYAWSRIARQTEILRHCDAVITGRFVQGRNTGETPLRGSANQRIVPLSELGRSRYADPSEQRELQVSADGGQLRLIGIPGPGVLDRLTGDLREAGLDLTGATWLE